MTSLSPASVAAGFRLVKKKENISKIIIPFLFNIFYLFDPQDNSKDHGKPIRF